VELFRAFPLVSHPSGLRPPDAVDRRRRVHSGAQIQLPRPVEQILRDPAFLVETDGDGGRYRTTTDCFSPRHCDFVIL
jgi:hypothetical protein